MLTQLDPSGFQMKTLGSWKALELAWGPGACLLWPLSAGTDTPRTLCRDRDVPRCRVSLNLLIEMVSNQGKACVPLECLETAICDLISICRDLLGSCVLSLFVLSLQVGGEICITWPL